jgi:hypothetical protein
MPHLSTYVGLADHSEKALAEAFRAVAEGTSSTPATCSPSGATAIARHSHQ